MIKLIIALILLSPIAHAKVSDACQAAVMNHLKSKAAELVSDSEEVILRYSTQNQPESAEIYYLVDPSASYSRSILQFKISVNESCQVTSELLSKGPKPTLAKNLPCNNINKLAMSDIFNSISDVYLYNTLSAVNVTPGSYDQEYEVLSRAESFSNQGKRKEHLVRLTYHSPFICDRLKLKTLSIIESREIE